MATWPAMSAWRAFFLLQKDHGMKPHVPNPTGLIAGYINIAQAIPAAFRSPNVKALMLLAGGIVTFSALIYMMLEGWAFLDAVYFCVVTMSTVGYGDFAPKTALGKIYTIFYLLIGIGIFVLTVTAIAEAIYSEFRARSDAPKTDD
jgi:voltage-gated potassium channel